MDTYGYIYIRRHTSYDQYEVCKLGKTNNIPERDNQYATGEIERGYFEIVLEVEKKHATYIERILQYIFKKYNIKYNGGIEFYSIKIIDLIIPYLTKIRIKFRKLTEKEINELLRINRLKNILQKINIKDLLNAIRITDLELSLQRLIIKEFDKNIIKKQEIQPRKDQEEIINKSIEYFKTNDKGILIIPCGVGKTLISLWLIKKNRNEKNNNRSTKYIIIKTMVTNNKSNSKLFISK